MFNNFEEIYKKSKKIKLIPDNKLTQKICDEDYKIFKNIENIPYNFRTQEMYNDLFDKTIDITKIPKTFITQKMCDKHFEKYKNTNNIPYKFITMEMFDEMKKSNNYSVPQNLMSIQNHKECYFKTKKFNDIPKEYLSQEVCDDFFRNEYKNIYDSKSLNKLILCNYGSHNNDNICIPEKFQTQEMWDKYFEYFYNNQNKSCYDLNFEPQRDYRWYQDYGSRNEELDKRLDFESDMSKYDINYVIKRIPKKFITNDMIKKFLQINHENRFIHFCSNEKTIELVRNQDIADFKYKLTKCIDCIPKEFRTKEMCENIKDVTKIPINFITQQMCDDDFKEYKDIKRIPEKFITQQMCDEYYSKNNNVSFHNIRKNNIYDIPQKFQTQEMWDDYFKKNMSITFIPENFITQKMCNEYFKKYQKINFPLKFVTKNMLS